MILEDYSDAVVLDAIRRGRVALSTRYSQLTACRACGAELAEMERAVQILRELEEELTRETTP